MDLGAYAQIDDLDEVMKKNGISVPRLRGLRLMKDEEPTSKDRIEEIAFEHGVNACKDLCESFFSSLNPDWFELSIRTDRLIKRHMIKGKNWYPVNINWRNTHGRKRKMFRYAMKTAKKRVIKQYEVFNKYCGQDGILYIHARIGGGNWDYFGGAELTKQPWFIEKVDDAFDCTYCDIYAKIEVKHE